MRILLTGSDGFTGRAFIEAASAAGHETIALTADLRDCPALSAEIAESQADAVLHLAAISFVGHGTDVDFYEVNTVGTTNLLRSLATSGWNPSRVVLASSANIYGNALASPVSETAVPSPVNHYAMSKLAMELMARNYFDRLPIVIARPFNYTGPGQSGHFLIPKLVGHFAQGKPEIALGNLDVEREFNDVGMVCEAYLQLLQCGEIGETYNICTGRAYTLRDTLARLESMTGHRPKVSVDPALVRPNEVQSLYGDPAKLLSLLRRNGKSLTAADFNATLGNMIDALANPMTPG